jgi:alkaline phosphatase D
MASDNGRLGRREFVIAGAGAGVALTGLGPLNYVALAKQRKLPLASAGKFAHGVASGIPTPQAITLWTRVSELTRSSRLTLEVATDEQFGNVVNRQTVVADAARDFTVHATAGSLQPAQQYYYRFHTKHSASGVGRFRTLPPADSNQPVKVGFYSCQSYEAGYFTAQAALADEPDLDLVLCLGDYIYEHHYYKGPAERADKTGANKDGDVQTLAEYRQKYRFYQSDQNLQKLHAAYPFVVIWDDHEVEDNYAGSRPDSASKNPAKKENNNTYPRRVPFGQRRRNGYRAFFEAMPRLTPKGNRLYGSLKLGNMAELFLTDERQYRDPQPCHDVLITSCPDDLKPGRTFLGARQKSWLKGALPASKAKWSLLASETMMMAFDSAPNSHGNQDQWDGYSAEREEILTAFLNKQVDNLVVLSGDIHTFIAGDLYTNGETSGKPIGVELVGGSATSYGLSEFFGISPDALEKLRQSADPHLTYAEWEHHGYAVVTADADKLVGEFKAVSDTKVPNGTASTLATFQVDSGTPKLHQL